VRRPIAQIRHTLTHELAMRGAVRGSFALFSVNEFPGAPAVFHLNNRSMPMPGSPVIGTPLSDPFVSPPSIHPPQRSQAAGPHYSYYDPHFSHHDNPYSQDPFPEVDPALGQVGGSRFPDGQTFEDTTYTAIGNLRELDEAFEQQAEHGAALEQEWQQRGSSSFSSSSD
jgi:hypothetical protein